MKEELQGKLVEILTSIQTAAGKASDFAMEQLPDIAQSYVAYGRVSASISMAVCLLLVAIGAFLFLRMGLFGKEVDQYGGWSENRMSFFAAGILIGLFGLVVSLFNMSSFLLVWMAPKVWLLKEIAALIR